MSPFRQTIIREIKRLCSRPIYLVGMLIVPICVAFYFITLLNQGLPLPVPVGVVDLDHTQMSRQLTRSLSAIETIDVAQKEESFHQAMDDVQEGKTFGFFVIPEDFERKAVNGDETALTFYSNLTYFVPGTMAFKGFKTMAVTTSGGIVQTNLTYMGAPDLLVDALLQPMTVTNHPLKNPWLNYNYYLGPPFLYGTLELMIFLMSFFAMCHEIKDGSSPQWLATARGKVSTAILGKLLPQTVIFTIFGCALNAVMFNFLHFPMNGSTLWMLIATILFVIAAQSFALIVFEVMPNLRLGLSICALTGILALSIAAFSFPVDSMYGAVAIFADILPVRWYYLIFTDLALNGLAPWYARFYFLALLIFPLVAIAGLFLLKKRLQHPVYVP